MGDRPRAARERHARCFAAYLTTLDSPRDRRAASRQEGRRRLRGGRGAAQAARPSRLRAADDPLRRGRGRPGARGGRPDRVRARHADHHRPGAVPRARQAGDRPHARGAARRQAGATSPSARRARAQASDERTPEQKLDVRAPRGCPRADRPGARHEPGPRRRAAAEARDRRPERHGRRAVLRLRPARAGPARLPRHAATTRSRRSPRTASASCSSEHRDDDDADAEERRARQDEGRLRRGRGRRRLAVEVRRGRAGPRASSTAACSSCSPPRPTRTTWCSRRASAAGRCCPRSRKDIARKAFERVTKQVLPASHVQLAPRPGARGARVRQTPRGARAPSSRAPNAAADGERRRRGRGRAGGGRGLAPGWAGPTAVPSIARRRRASGAGSVPPRRDRETERTLIMGTALTDAERAERRAADRDRLEQAARELLSSEGWSDGCASAPRTGWRATRSATSC